jgi:hypothetical protein
VSIKISISDWLFDCFRTVWRKAKVIQEFQMKGKMLLISDSYLEIDAERRGELLS